MKPTDHEQGIINLGWETEFVGDQFRARLAVNRGHFVTPWLASWEQVLQSIEAADTKREGK